MLEVRERDIIVFTIHWMGGKHEEIGEIIKKDDSMIAADIYHSIDGIRKWCISTKGNFENKIRLATKEERLKCTLKKLTADGGR